MLTSTNLKPSDFFNIDYRNDDEYPFNISFANKVLGDTTSKFYGPGIYSIFDKINNKLVYIGLWCPNSQSVIKERFRKHIQTLTLRGGNVKFKKAEKVSLNDFCVQNNTLNLYDALSKSTSIENRLHADGIVAGSRKVKYASQNWNDFSSWLSLEDAATALDKRFRFQYNKIENFFDEELEAKKLRAQIREYFELPLITHCNPVANAEYTSNKITLEYIDKNNICGTDVISEMIDNIIKVNENKVK